MTDLDVKMELETWKVGYSKEVVEDSFLENMELSLKMKNNLFQNQFFLNHQRLYRFCWARDYGLGKIRDQIRAGRIQSTIKSRTTLSRAAF